MVSRVTWHGPWAAAASLLGTAAGAEGAAVERPAVPPQPPLHVQGEGRPLQGDTAETEGHIETRLTPFYTI